MKYFCCHLNKVYPAAHELFGISIGLSLIFFKYHKFKAQTLEPVSSLKPNLNRRPVCQRTNLTSKPCTYSTVVLQVLK